MVQGQQYLMIQTFAILGQSAKKYQTLIPTKNSHLKLWLLGDDDKHIYTTVTNSLKQSCYVVDVEHIV